MTRGARPSPKSGPKGVSHHDSQAERVVEIVPQEHSNVIALGIAEELPDGMPRQVFLRSVDELGDRLRDTDLEALRLMSWALYRSSEAQRDVEERGMFEENELYGRRPNPALKVARDEANLYLKIADQYALTFVSRLRAGILQLAGQSMMAQLHESMAASVVARILSSDQVERRAIAAVAAPCFCCDDCGREFGSRRGLSLHRHHAHPAKKRKKR